jgi:hypothetical protein
MKKALLATFIALAAAVPFTSSAAPDEAQKQLIQRAQEAKKKLSAAQAAQGAERDKLMQEHMKIMQDTMAQMQKAKPRAGMKPEEMRDWIEEHMKLMHEMMSQMMSGHRMMQGGGMGMGMGKK